ncbi:unnamed protein product [Cuscuta epithymum]|uniref:Phototropic-responsive NPH3 family protein n=1 Tax=Cuscuta epithymum TaxID=186058 RepID=A0AAV0E4E5_9ASTE|nr:unnamed protein product [Cuscuta epithymum]CAH9144599.1 unnamed protein product [Cuscuta epithymum]
MKFMKLGSKPDCFHSAGNNVRYIASELASDIIIFVGDIKFYLHKFPLLSKSSRLQKLIAKSVEGSSEIHIEDIPGGPAAFEICAKFCYGVTVTLNAYNVIAARCASEYLGMNENTEKGNLIYKIDVFLHSSIFRSWKDSIISLQSMKSPLFPLCEELKLVSHCIDSIASKASADVSKVDWSYTYNRSKVSEEIGLRSRIVPKDWWVEDLSELEVDLYKQVIVNIKKKGLVPNEVIGEALKTYASKRLQGYHDIGTEIDASKYRSVLDAILLLLPTEKGSVSTNFLFKLLKAYISVEAGEMEKKELIKRISRQLEEASVNDLLIRTSDGETASPMYNVDVVQKILSEFMMSNEEDCGTKSEVCDEIQNVKKPVGVLNEASKLMVAKLVDGYLAEIAKDPNLTSSSFVGVAEMVAGFPRPAHDGLYRAIDMYLKQHPGINKSEKKRICRLMDCKKLSADACMHAIQNERLPSRVVVQVLFFEQVRAAHNTSSSGSTTPELPHPTKPVTSASYGSSRSATTTEEDWDAAGSAEELRALRSELAALKLENADKAATMGKMKGLVVSKKVFSKIWSFKGGHGGSGENSGSDSSESLGCTTNMEEAKSSTSSRKTKHSLT